MPRYAGKAPPNPHDCKLPGRWWRFRYVFNGKVWRCNQCGARWMWCPDRTKNELPMHWGLYVPGKAAH